MPLYKEHATQEAALDASAVICDRLMPQPRAQRTTRYWFQVLVDPDDALAAMVVLDGEEGVLTPAEQAELVTFDDLSPTLQGFFFVMDMPSHLQVVNGGQIIVWFDQMKANLRNQLKALLVNEPDLATEFFGLLNAGQERKVRDELGPPL